MQPSIIVQTLLKLRLELEAYCRSPEFDQKTFGTQWKAFANLYRRADVAEQGEYSHLLSQITETKHE